jgi:HAD superfamily hydrolase (TIGR01549 family)
MPHNPTFYLWVSNYVSVIKLIIFDAGGVLYNGNQKMVDEAVERFLEKHGVHDFDMNDRVWSKIEKLVSVGKISKREAHERWLEGVGLHKDLLGEWSDINRKEIWGRFERTPGINKLLVKLKKDYALAILSDTIESKPEKIETMQIVGVNYKIFDEIFTSHDLGVCKPSRKAFHAVLKRFDVKPREAVFVGDASDELEGAKRIGLVAIGFNSSGGDFKVKKLDEIQGILRTFARREMCEAKSSLIKSRKRVEGKS